MRNIRSANRKRRNDGIRIQRTQSSQCRALTRSGRRCSHEATHEAEGGAVCSQHFLNGAPSVESWRAKSPIAGTSSGGKTGTIVRTEKSRSPRRAKLANELTSEALAAIERVSRLGGLSADQLNTIMMAAGEIRELRKAIAA